MNGDGALPGCPQPASGMPLAEALGVEPATARALDARARHGAGVEYVRALPAPGGTPRWLRVGMAPTGRGSGGAGSRPRRAPGGSAAAPHFPALELAQSRASQPALQREDGGADPRPERRASPRGTSAGSPSPSGRFRTLERMLWMLSEYGREAPLAVDTWSLPDLIQESSGLIEQDLAERSIRLELLGVEGLPRVRSDGIRLRPGPGPAAAERGLEPRGGRAAAPDAAPLGPGRRGGGARRARRARARRPVAGLRAVRVPPGARRGTVAGRAPAGDAAAGWRGHRPSPRRLRHRGVLFRLDFARAA